MDTIGTFENVISEIQRLTSAKKILNPEQAILRCLTFFDILLKRTPKDFFNSNNDKNNNLKNVDLINDCLYQLTKIEHGNLSFQCSISISQHICAFYKKQRNPPFEQLLNLLIPDINTSIAATIVVGDICFNYEKIDVNLVEKTILVLSTHLSRLENIYSTHKIIKKFSNEQKISKYSQKIYNCIVKNFFSYQDKCHIFVFKLLRALIKSDFSLCMGAILFSKTVLKLKGISKFVRNESSKLVASIARLYFCGSNSQKDKKQAFSILNELKILSSDVINKFFEKLPIDVIISEHALLFDFVKESSPYSITKISPFLPKSVRDKYFGQILIERNQTIEQVMILKELNIDDYSTASLAANLVYSSKHLSMHSHIEYEFASNFFKRYLDTDTQRIFLRNSLKKLLNNKFSIGDFIIARSLLYSDANDDPSIDEFVATLLQLKYYTNPLLWIIATIKWRKLKNDDLKFLSNKNNKDFINNEIIENAIETVYSTNGILLIEALTQYFSIVNPMHKASSSLIEYLSKNLKNITHITLFYLINLCEINPLFNNTFVPFFVRWFLTNPPSNKAFYTELIANPMQFSLEKTNAINIFHNYSSNTNVNDNINDFYKDSVQISYKIIYKIAKLYETVNDETKSLIINDLVSSASKESHSLILQLVKAKLVFLDIDSLLLSLTGTDYIRLQLTCEIISYLNPPMEKIESFVEVLLNKRKESDKNVTPDTNKNSSFLLLSSIFCNSQTLNEIYIKKFFGFLDLKLICSDLFALHALSSIIFAKSVEIIALDLGTDLLSNLFSVINTESSLKPLYLKLYSEILINILPIFSIDLSQNKEIVALILSIIESIKCCSIESSKRLFYEVSTVCLTYAPNFASSYFEFKFPYNSPKTVKFAAIKAITQFFKILNTITLKPLIDLNQDKIFIREVFIFLQQTKDERIVDCIESFCNYISKSKSKDFLVQINYIANNIFAMNCLPGFTSIEPLQIVRDAALECIDALNNIPQQFNYFMKALSLFTSPYISHVFQHLSKFFVHNRVHILSLYHYKDYILDIVNFAFSSNLEYSKEFIKTIITYFLFSKSIVLKDSLLIDIFNSFLISKQRSSDFFELVTMLCQTVSRSNLLSYLKCNENEYLVTIKNQMMTFTKLMVPMFRELIDKILHNQLNKNEELLLSSFYLFLYQSYVYLEKVFLVLKDESQDNVPSFAIPNDQLYSFLNIGLLTNNENNSLAPIFYGLIECVKQFDDPIELDLIDETLQGIIRLQSFTKTYFENEINEYCLYALKNQNLNKECCAKIFYLAQGISFNFEVVNLIMKKCSFDHLPTFKIKECNFYKQEIALYRMINDKSKLNPYVTDKFNQFDCYRKIIHNIIHVDFSKDQLEEILLFAYNNIKIGHLILYEIITSNEANQFNSYLLPHLINWTMHRFNDRPFKRDALLLSLFVQQSNNSNVLTLFSKFALETLLSKGSGPKTRTHTIYIIMLIRALANKNNSILSEAWKVLKPEEKQKIFSQLETH